MTDECATDVSIRPRKLRVVIVGAGFAGLAAARHLSADKRFSVVLLEGSGRVGGRAKSVLGFSGCPPMDLGCTWAYKTDDEAADSIFQYACKNGHLRFDRLPTPKPAMYLLSTGEKLRADEIEACVLPYRMAQRELRARVVSGDWRSTIYMNPAWQRTQLDPAELSTLDYHDYMTRRFLEVTNSEELKLRTKTLKPVHVLQQLLGFEGILDGTQESKDVAVMSYNDFDDPYTSVRTTKGFQAIAEDIASHLPNECLNLKKDVTSIQWTPPSSTSGSCNLPVCVHCSDGSMYQADHVIMTVSLGVLKQRCCCLESVDPLFTPSLPKTKLDAICKLGMGQVNKVLLQFPKPLAGGRAGNLKLYWRDEELGFAEKYPWISKLGLLYHTGGSTYEAWLTGDNAVAIEHLKDSEIAKGFSLVLENFLQQSVGWPKVVRSSWSSDKFFRGSYSYNAVGSSKLDRLELGKPVDGSSPLQLLFAGEATHPSLFSTTNGAFQSGVREAERLIKHCDKNNHVRACS